MIHRKAQCVTTGLLACLLITFGGCAAQSTVKADGRYRTVGNEPRRDTDAARRANEAGLEHLAEGRLDAAADDFNRALTADVEFGPAHNNLGKVYFQNRDWYRAAWEFEYAARLLPEHAEPHNNLGLVLEKTGQLDRAVDEYRQAVAFEPQRIEYVGNLARALVRRGDATDEVRQLLATLLERDTRPEWVNWAKQQQIRLGDRPTPGQ